ncbi:MAG: hypothetical protein ACI9WU_002478 [Myxococcota bacterium]|jgi:hypothetical protein
MLQTLSPSGQLKGAVDLDKEAITSFWSVGPSPSLFPPLPQDAEFWNASCDSWAHQTGDIGHGGGWRALDNAKGIIGDFKMEFCSNSLMSLLPLLPDDALLTSVHLDRQHYPLAALFVAGDELFEYAFRPEDGLGNGLTDFAAAGDSSRPNQRRVQSGAFGGPDGAGTKTQNVFFRSDGDRTLGPDQRNPPHVLGPGPIEALAALGVSFGSLTAHPDGSVDTSEIAGFDPDLVVRPFGWKGHRATIRGISEESFRIHLGLVSTRIQERVHQGHLNPAALGDGPWSDVDADGQSAEIDDGMLTTITAYLAQLEVPVIRPPGTERLQEAFAAGQHLFVQVGCASCHIPTLELSRPEIPLDATHTVDVARDGEEPKLEPKDGQESAFLVHLFSDLRRHDMGPGLAAPTAQSHIPARVFLTRPLWGLADTAPYLHDGRAPTIHAATLAHGGEAEDSRLAYHGLSPADQGALQVYLLSLTRTPGLLVP